VKPYITTVVTPAATRDLVALDDVREQLQFRSNDTAQDAWLAKVITRTSQQAERYCNRIFAQQDYQDTFGIVDGDPGTPLMLGQAPVVVTLVTVDGGDLDATSYIADAGPGLLYNAIQPRQWVSTDAILIQYTGGFEPIPDDVQQAVISLAVMAYRGRSRDPMLRERETPGLGREQFWIGPAPGENILPGDIASLLNPYRRGMIG
jgi:hypothetical protein